MLDPVGRSRMKIPLKSRFTFNIYLTKDVKKQMKKDNIVKKLRHICGLNEHYRILGVHYVQCSAYLLYVQYEYWSQHNGNHVRVNVMQLKQCLTKGRSKISIRGKSLHQLQTLKKIL